MDVHRRAQVRNLAQVQRGDRVLVQYFQGLALGLGPVGSGVRERVDKLYLSRAKPGEKPYGEIKATIDVVGTVQAIDPRRAW